MEPHCGKKEGYIQSLGQKDDKEDWCFVWGNAQDLKEEGECCQFAVEVEEVVHNTKKEEDRGQENIHAEEGDRQEGCETVDIEEERRWQEDDHAKENGIKGTVRIGQQDGEEASDKVRCHRNI